MSNTSLEKLSFNEVLKEFCMQPMYALSDSIEIMDNPYGRPLPISGDNIKDMAFEKILSVEKLNCKSSYLASLMLRIIYELDLLFLPENNFSQKDFDIFYSSKNLQLGELIRPVLEEHVYGFLENHVQISGAWNSDTIIEYLLEDHLALEKATSPIPKILLESSNPKRSALNFLIRLAPDTLSEGSALARRLLGTFGPIQSELFKILIDEYGYGIFNHKHSTLFQSMLVSCGLSSSIHRYWHYYTPSSLLFHNYFHYTSKNTRLFFRYVGQLFFAEATFSTASAQYAKTLRQIFGLNMDFRYFDEHVGIDVHHGRMVMENIVKKIFKQYGVEAGIEILRGYEEFKFLIGKSRESFQAQIEWLDTVEPIKTATLFNSKCQGIIVEIPKNIFTSASESPTIFSVLEGKVVLFPGFGHSFSIKSGESVAIPSNVHYGYFASEIGTKINFFEHQHDHPF